MLSHGPFLTSSPFHHDDVFFPQSKQFIFTVVVKGGFHSMGYILGLRYFGPLGHCVHTGILPNLQGPIYYH